MEWLTDPTIWVGLLTLVVLEIILGIDNLIFIAILADKLRPSQRDRARVIDGANGHHPRSVRDRSVMAARRCDGEPASVRAPEPAPAAHCARAHALARLRCDHWMAAGPLVAASRRLGLAPTARCARVRVHGRPLRCRQAGVAPSVAALRQPVARAPGHGLAAAPACRSSLAR